MTVNKTKSSAWGFGAAAIYIGFVLFILGLVMYASIQDVQLVEEGYYEEGLAYQDRIDRMARTSKAPVQLRIKHDYTAGAIELSFADSAVAESLMGEIHLFRPSNSRLDRFFPLDLGGAGYQVIATDGMARGLWLIEVDWNVDTLGYYSQSRIIIP